MPDPDQPQGVLERLKAGLRHDDIGGLSAEIAYRFLFAVFPFGLFVAAMSSVVAGWLRIEDPAGRIVAALGDNLPPDLAGAIPPELAHLLTSARTDLVLVGAVAALWAATGGTNALTKGIHRAYGVEEQRPFVLRYAIALGLTILGAIGIITAFVTIVGGAFLTQELADSAGLGQQAFALLQLLRWPAVFAVLVIAVAILYRFGSSVVVPWRWIFVGAVAFASGWLVATAVLAFYVANVADYGATYGSLGGVIVLMLWFYITAAVLVLGAEVTAALARERSPGSITRRGEEIQAIQAVERATQGVTDTARGAVTDAR